LPNLDELSEYLKSQESAYDDDIPIATEYGTDFTLPLEVK